MAKPSATCHEDIGWREKHPAIFIDCRTVPLRDPKKCQERMRWILYHVEQAFFDRLGSKVIISAENGDDFLLKLEMNMLELASNPRRVNAERLRYLNQTKSVVVAH